MNKDDIIRRFLMLHPETPIDMREYAVPLLIIKNLLENCMEYERKVEREACAKVCYDKSWELKNEAMKSESKTKGVRLNDCAIVLYDAHKAIRARGQE